MSEKKYIFEILMFFIFIVIATLSAILGLQVRKVKNELNTERQKNELLRLENLKLSDNLKNIEVFESHWQEIEDYIKWKDKIIMSAQKPIPELERTREEMEKEKIKVFEEVIRRSY